MSRYSFHFVIPFLLLFQMGAASALTSDEFFAICESSERECSEVPILQAYLGGSFDLIAMLDEETDYLGQVYCKAPKELFDVKAIVQFMGNIREEYGSKNAMLSVIRYLEQKGGCK